MFIFLHTISAVLSKEFKCPILFTGIPHEVTDSKEAGDSSRDLAHQVMERFAKKINCMPSSSMFVNGTLLESTYYEKKRNELPSYYLDLLLFSLTCFTAALYGANQLGFKCDGSLVNNFWDIQRFLSEL